MKRSLQARFEEMPEPKQHLCKAIGAGLVAGAFLVYGGSVRPDAQHESGLEAAADGLHAAVKVVISLAGVVTSGVVALEEVDKYISARQTERSVAT